MSDQQTERAMHEDRLVITAAAFITSVCIFIATIDVGQEVGHQGTVLAFDFIAAGILLIGILNWVLFPYIPEAYK